jgi:hypothetical protein
VIESGGDAFDSAALRAVASLRFDPATKDGVAILARIPFRFEFAPPPAVEPEPQPVPAPVAAPPDDPAHDEPLLADGLTLEVRGERPPVETTVHRMEPEQIRTIPGTNGDALRAVETLPGVARPPGVDGQLVVRGSSPQDTAIFIDGISVPSAYHFGGMVSVILHQGGRNDIKTYQRGSSTPVPFDCGNSDQAWAQVYLYAIDHMNGGAVGIGSDFNGLAGEPAPRFGGDACDGDRSDPYNPAGGISYPITPFGGGGPIGQMQIGSRTFNYNTDGLANIGLYPDFIADLQANGMTNQDLSPLFRSAEAYVRMWEAASDVTPPDVACSTPTEATAQTACGSSMENDEKPTERAPRKPPTISGFTSSSARLSTPAVDRLSSKVVSTLKRSRDQVRRGQ